MDSVFPWYFLPTSHSSFFCAWLTLRVNREEKKCGENKSPSNKRQRISKCRGFRFVQQMTQRGNKSKFVLFLLHLITECIGPERDHWQSAGLTSFLRSIT